MLSLWANWLVTKFGLNSLKRYLWPVLYIASIITYSVYDGCFCVYVVKDRVGMSDEQSVAPWDTISCCQWEYAGQLPWVMH